MYVVAQALGLLSTVLCFVNPYFKHKWQMLVVSMVANVLVAANTLLLQGMCASVWLNLVAILQVGLMLMHLHWDKPVTVWENVVFLIIYVGCGSLSYHRLLDLLPIGGAVLFMLGAFERDEQRTRVINMGNALCYFLYFAIIGSTSALAQVAALINTAVALIAYRKKR